MWTSPLLDDLPHAFTGVAEGDLTPAADPGGRAAAALVARLGGRGPLRMARQVHGHTVVVGEEVDAAAPPEADGLVATTPGVVVAVRVADCVPVLLVAAREGRVRGVAALHAGWRGTAADIVRIGVAALERATGLGPADMRAAVGPAICGACYEVSPEVVAAVAAVAPGREWLTAPRHVDLRLANLAVLRERGVRAELAGGCTRCGPGAWSHRRDGAAAGRQVGAVAVPS